MKTHYIPVFLLCLLITACTVEEAKKQIDIQGHRGARGLLPENTIPSFLKAIDYGVDTIEFDMVVTKDRRILISHEPWFDHNISTKPDGTPVTEEEQRNFNIFEMTYEETQQFDVGKRGHQNFPNQQPLEVTKPLLIDAIHAIEEYTTEKGLPPVAYNIETKSVPDEYGTYYPHPDEFANLLFDELSELNEQYNFFDRVIVQSFDPATLIEFRKLTDDIALAMLIFDETPIQQFIDTLGFAPEIWSPHYSLVSDALIEEARSNNMLVIPWTINTTAEMNRQIELGVDGIITDYPDSAAIVMQNLD